MKNENIYDRRYAQEEYYWGKNASPICDRVIEIVVPKLDFRPKLLDLGCGEGRNLIYFAKHGFDVTGLDISVTGLEKTKKYAEEEGVNITLIQGDILTHMIEDKFDVIFSSGTLHYFPPDIRNERFKHLKESTSPIGINVHTVLVSKPFIPEVPDAEKNVYLFKSGELMGYFWDWEIIYSEEEIFDCRSGGVPHKHTANRIIARRYVNE